MEMNESKVRKIKSDLFLKFAHGTSPQPNLQNAQGCKNDESEKTQNKQRKMPSAAESKIEN